MDGTGSAFYRVPGFGISSDKYADCTSRELISGVKSLPKGMARLWYGYINLKHFFVSIISLTSEGQKGKRYVCEFKTLIIRLLHFRTACFCQANTAATRFFISKDVIYILNYTLALVKMCSHINNNAETSIAVTEKWIECVRGVSCRGSIELKTWRQEE
jgi:hypothetical protein